MQIKKETWLPWAGVIGGLIFWLVFSILFLPSDFRNIAAAELGHQGGSALLISWNVYVGFILNFGKHYSFISTENLTGSTEVIIINILVCGVGAALNLLSAKAIFYRPDRRSPLTLNDLKHSAVLIPCFAIFAAMAVFSTSVFKDHSSESIVNQSYSLLGSTFLLNLYIGTQLRSLYFLYIKLKEKCGA